MSEIQNPDPTTQRRVRLFALGFLLLMLFSLFELQAYRETLQDWILEHSDYLLNHPGRVAVIFFILNLPIWAGCVLVWRFADRIVVTQRFPPTGMKVIRETVVLTGQAAVLRGYLIKSVAALMAITCMLIPVMLWLILSKLAGQ